MGLVQSGIGSANSSDTVAASASLGTATTSGNTLIAVYFVFVGAGNTLSGTTMTDNKGNTWTKVTQYNTTNVVNPPASYIAEIWKAPVSTAGLTTVTAGPSGYSQVLWIGEFAGSLTVPTTPSTAIAGEAFNNDGGTASFSAPAITTTAANLTVVAGIAQYYNNQTGAVASPYTMANKTHTTAGTLILAGVATATIANSGTQTTPSWSSFQAFQDTIVLQFQLVPAAGGSASLSDTVAVSGAISRTSAQSRTNTDTASVTDSQARAQTQTARALAENSTISDTVSRSSLMTRPVTDSFTVGDTVAGRQMVSARTLSEAAAVTDTVQRAIVASRILTDTAPVADTVARQTIASRVTTDTVTFADAVQRAQTGQRGTSDSLPVSDTVTVGTSNTRAVSDDTTVYDTLTGEQYQSRALSDTATVSDTVSRAQNPAARTPADSLPVADTVSRSQIQTPRIVSDVTAVTDLVSDRTALGSRQVADDMTVSDLLARFGTATRGTADNLPVSDIVSTGGAFIRYTTDGVTVTDDWSRSQVQAERQVFDDTTVSDDTARSQAGQRGTTDLLPVDVAMSGSIGSLRTLNDDTTVDSTRTAMSLQQRLLSAVAPISDIVSRLAQYTQRFIIELVNLVDNITGHYPPKPEFRMTPLPSAWELEATMEKIATVDLDEDRVQVTATIGGQAYNPTSDPVYFAYLRLPPTVAKPTMADFQPGTWETITITPGRTAYVAKCLIGPGGRVTLQPGRYYRWVKISDNPTIPVKPVGTLDVY